MANMEFPDDFIWGVATASYQIEGSPLVDGAGPSIWHRFTHTPGTIHNGDTGDVACDHYRRYKEDVALMKSLGIKGYRFSISWSRIFPEGKGRINERGFSFYDQLIDELLKANITPFVTIYHWDLPAALQDIGGWTNRDIAYWFSDYADYLFQRLGDRVKHWITLNEPWVTAFEGHLFGSHAPGMKDIFSAFTVVHNELRAHSKAVEAFREENIGGKIGITLSNHSVSQVSQNERDVMTAGVAHEFINYPLFLNPIYNGSYPEHLLSVTKQYMPRDYDRDMNEIRRPIDFVGINYYSGSLIRFNPEKPLGIETIDRGLKKTEMGWEIYPEGLYKILKGVQNIYAPKEIFITENGVAFKDITEGEEVHDQNRIEYLKAHFAQAYRAIKDGVRLRGYFVWSLMDNFEWAYGYSKRFGIVYVDYKTQKRIIKDSGKWYANIISKNSIISGEPGIREYGKDGNMHKSIDLDGSWRLNGEEVMIPSCWPVDFTTGKTFIKEGIYTKEIYIDEQEKGKQFILRFYGIDYYADIWLNGRHVGFHEGGYDSFEFNITSFISFGTDNLLEVKVKDIDSDSPDYSYILHGKQDWYGNVSGIWQPVELLISNLPYIKDVRVYPNVKGNFVKMFFDLVGTKPEDTYTLTCRVLDEEGDVVERGEFTLKSLEEGHIWRFKSLLNPWSPETPYLYRLKTTLRDGKGSEVDEFDTKFGMREIFIEDGKILLNDKPFYTIGVLDQAFYPETFYTEPNKESLIREFELTKKMGINTLRCHVKIPSDAYLEAADETGLLVWIDLPYANKMNAKSKRANRMLAENVLKRFANHPSFVILSLINEGWGLSLAESIENRTWLKESHSLAKKIDPSRLIVDNSPCQGNFHIKSDINDWHLYYAYPEHTKEWNTALDSFIDGKTKTFWNAANGKAQPKIVSEFGLWSIPDVDVGEDWMKLAPLGLESFSPKEIKERFKRFHLDEFYSSFERLCRMTQMQEFYGLKYQIEEMRKREAIQGYVITECTDILWEANGLLDFHRKPKVFYPLLKDVNNPIALLIDPPIAELITNEERKVSVVISNKSALALSNVTLRYGFENIGFRIEKIEKINAFSNYVLKDVYINPPYAEINADHRFTLELRRGNELLAENTYTMRVYTPSPLPDDLAITDDPAHLEDITSNRVLLCITKEPEDKEFLKEMGIDVIREDKSVSTLPFAPWKGDWISTFIYYERDRFRNSLGDDYAGVHLKPFFTDLLIDIKEPELFRSIIIGKFIGWIYDVTALALKVKYKGKDIVVTTLDLMKSGILRDNIIKDIVWDGNEVR